MGIFIHIRQVCNFRKTQEIDARVTRLAEIRSEIGREAGCCAGDPGRGDPALPDGHAPRPFGRNRRSVERGSGPRPGTIAVLGGRVEGDHPGNGRPDVCVASDRGSRGRTDRRSGRGRWREIQAEWKVVKEDATRREGDVELTDFDGSGYRGWFVEDQAFGPAPLRPGAISTGDGSLPTDRHDRPRRGVGA